jgi:CRISPR/Cas system-associated exonuclease Cas4 (RecB family)
MLLGRVARTRPMPDLSLPQIEPEWKAKARSDSAKFSISQIENYELCPRKWWFQSVRKMPVWSKQSQVIGTVLHSVLERSFSSV